MSPAFQFLVASERSGSNFLTRMVGAHSRISGPAPTHLFRLFSGNGWRYHPLTDDRNWQYLVDDVLENFAVKLGNWDLDPDRGSLLSATPRTIATPICALYESQAEIEGADVAFVKENQTASFADFLLRSRPEARFVHLVRDPRDVAASWIRTRGMPGGVASSVSAWVRDQSLACELERALRVEGQELLRIRYEDLVRNPARELGRYFEGSGLEFEPVHELYFRQRSVREDSSRVQAWENLGRPVLSDNTRRYSRELTSDEIRYVEFTCRDLMNSFAYEPSLPTLDVAPPTPPDRRTEPTEDPDPESSETFRRRRRLEALERVLHRRPATSEPT